MKGLLEQIEVNNYQPLTKQKIEECFEKINIKQKENELWEKVKNNMKKLKKEIPIELIFHIHCFPSMPMRIYKKYKEWFE